MEKLTFDTGGRSAWEHLTPEQDQEIDVLVQELMKENPDKATKAAEDEDAAIEANTGDFTADDIKDALESRTPAMQALLRARPDES